MTVPDKKLPAVFRNRTDEEDIQRDVEAMRGTTMTDRGRILVALCRMAAEQIAQHPDPQRVLDWQDPVSPETESLFARLRARWRQHD